MPEQKLLKSSPTIYLSKSIGIQRLVNRRECLNLWSTFKDFNIWKYAEYVQSWALRYGYLYFIDSLVCILILAMNFLLAVEFSHWQFDGTISRFTTVCICCMWFFESAEGCLQDVVCGTQIDSHFFAIYYYFPQVECIYKLQRWAWMGISLQAIDPI